MSATEDPAVITVEFTDAPLTDEAVSAWARVVWSAMEREAEADVDRLAAAVEGQR